MIPKVPQFLCFGGAGGGSAPPVTPSFVPVGKGFGIEKVAVFIRIEKAVANLRQSSGRTLDGQV
jgi:hypothetical protein